jgi:hypothetical protein
MMSASFADSIAPQGKGEVNLFPDTFVATFLMKWLGFLAPMS